MPRTKYPKLRAWAKPTRKIMTIVIPSTEDKLKQRPVKKEEARKGIQENLDEIIRK
jgi:hypothetical protein